MTVASMTHGRRSAAIALAWIVVMIAWVYGVFQTDAYWDAWWLLPWALVHVATGVALGLRAIPLAVLLPLIGIPVGTPADRETPAVFILAVGYVAPAAVLFAFGAIAAWLYRRRRSSRSG